MKIIFINGINLIKDKMKQRKKYYPQHDKESDEGQDNS